MSQSADLLDNVLPYAEVAFQRIKKLSLFTLGISLCMTVFFFMSQVTKIVDTFSLKPSDLPKFEMSRLTTYPLVHYSFLQYFLSLAAFIPLCERFERKYGSLRSLAMFLGPFESVPGLLYCLVNGVFLRHDTAIVGCSGFVFTMVAIECTQYAAKRNGKVVLGGRQLPAIALPFLLLAATTLFLPGSSISLHCASIAIGFIFGSGRVDFLLLPLKVVNFVESRVAPLVKSRLPMYVTAEDALQADEPALPTSESPSQRTSSEQHDMLRPVTPIPLTRKESNTTSRPVAGTRQVSSKWQTGQRQD
ncbi:protein of unknown function [Taphrina deformans PYCC 5710]|uniref:rhomboid protease n=1 Tax=Taphrina deformans (strain PYCC 5710 / ATCC 11124 / CBS 356.35 / IMI 108563 / JCM 9778 / NBRC 8474) TaxID=1097556 RepID=R4XEE2_TAPDE|nr:protein of unknown function [Taphrina deformans PYCC 5710]|eukprot:CCG84202.1 protein of unknown function [Taphrina deformans PYCC 5710]